MPKLYDNLADIESPFICFTCNMPLERGVHYKGENGDRFCHRHKGHMPKPKKVVKIKRKRGRPGNK